jgi:hypothetical protein
MDFWTDSNGDAASARAHDAMRTALAAELVAALAAVTPLIGPVSEIVAHPTLAPFYESYDPRGLVVGCTRLLNLVTRTDGRILRALRNAAVVRPPNLSATQWLEKNQFLEAVTWRSGLRSIRIPTPGRDSSLKPSSITCRGLRPVLSTLPGSWFLGSWLHRGISRGRRYTILSYSACFR